MRRFILALVLTSSTAFAVCPNLAGKYTSCFSASRNETTTEDIMITQRVINGATEYTVKSYNEDSQGYTTDVYMTDGKVRSQPLPENEGFFLNISSVCTNKNEVFVNMTVKAGNETFPVGTQTISKNGDQLKLVIKLEDQTETLTCK